MSCITSSSYDNSFHTALISALGVFLFAVATPLFIIDLSKWFTLPANAYSIYSFNGYNLIAFGIQMLLSIFMIFGARGIVRFIQKLRGRNPD